MNVETFAAVSTCLLALIAAGMAWLATRRALESNRIAVFDRRMSVYEAVRELLSEILREGRADFSETFALARAYQDSLFLFPAAVSDELKAIHGRAVAYARACRKTTPLDGDNGANIKREQELHAALVADLSGLPTIFLRDTSIAEWNGKRALADVSAQLADMKKWLQDNLDDESKVKKSKTTEPNS